MAPALRLRAVDYPDEALEPRLQQRFVDVAPDLFRSEVQKEARQPRIVRHALVAALHRRPHLLDPHRLVPIVRRRNGPAVRAKADQPRLLIEALLAELTDV